MTGQKTDIRTLDLKELEQVVSDYNQPAFRAKQVFEWIWKKGINNFESMTNIPDQLRKNLSEKFIFFTLDEINRAESTDGTIKLLFSLHDGKKTECVLIPSEDRVTACISSQTGCNLGCKFCSTAGIKKARDLSAGEIFEQFIVSDNLSVQKFGRPLSNLVLMGMGEPLLNYENVMNAVEKIISPSGLNFSPQRITLSTAGITAGIRKLADDDVKFNLAISLHAANEKIRQGLMPVTNSNTIEDLKKAIIYFHKKTGTRVTYEYLMLKDINDSAIHASEFAEFCKITPCKINLIEYNPGDFDVFKSSTPETIIRFSEILKSKNLIVNIRKSRGKDISAACGQLANKC